MRYVELVELRRQIYRHYAQTGGPPALAAEDLQALEAVHAVVLDAQGAIAFANPFATGLETRPTSPPPGSAEPFGGFPSAHPGGACTAVTGRDNAPVTSGFADSASWGC